MVPVFRIALPLSLAIFTIDLPVAHAQTLSEADLQATRAVLAAAAGGNDQSKPKTPGYHPSNLMIGTPEEVIKRIIAAQQACSFSAITIVPQFGTMPYEEAEKSTKLFAKEVLPFLKSWHSQAAKAAE